VFCRWPPRAIFPCFLRILLLSREGAGSISRPADCPLFIFLFFPLETIGQSRRGRVICQTDILSFLSLISSFCLRYELLETEGRGRRLMDGIRLLLLLHRIDTSLFLVLGYRVLLFLLLLFLAQYLHCVFGIYVTGTAPYCRSCNQIPENVSSI